MKKRLLWVFTLLVSIGVLTACSTPMFGDYTYTDFERVDRWDALDEIGHDDYALVYIYNRDFLGNETPGTQLINEDIFKFGMENDYGYVMYRINQREITGQRPDNIQRRDPKVLIMRHGEVVDKFYGALPIMTFLEAVEDGRYVFADIADDFTWDETDYSGSQLSDFPHLRTWREIQTLGRDRSGSVTAEMVFVYDSKEGETDLLYQSLLDHLFDWADETTPLYLINHSQTSGLLPEGYDHQSPALMIVVNENIVALYEETQSIETILEQLLNGSLTLDDYLD